MIELMLEAYHRGYEAYPRLNCAPNSNVEFMKIVPNCNFGDDKGCRIRVKLFKNYIRGWTSHLLEDQGK